MQRNLLRRNFILNCRVHIQCNIRSYIGCSPNIINNVFNNDTWVLQKPSLKHLPIQERDVTHYNGMTTKPFEFQLNEDNKSIYKTDITFKNQIDNSLRQLYHTHIRTETFDQTSKSPFLESSWLKLRDYIYMQLTNPQLPTQIKTYKPTVSQCVQPTEPSCLIAQLYNSNKIPSSTWRTVMHLSEETPVSDSLIYHHIISKTITYINEKEIIPQRLKTIDTDDTDSVDVGNPTEWYPEARKIKRHIILHLGPTNSGKTHRALKKLREADRGYYAGPLRLLAREVYDRFKQEGIPCNLLTGEEVISELDSLGNKVGITAGTVEMLPTTSEFDVVVLDEIQMMSDEDRGWAWTNVLLGAKAKEIHVCGEKSALPLIKKLIKITGDKLTVNEYERLGKLVIEDKPIGNNLKGLRKGDCIIAFSKKKILDTKLKIEKMTNLKVAVIYGSLPPETRVQQAALFNNGEYDVLVASDAIGMGLNLAIDRVIFNTDMKFNGTEMTTLTDSQIKQIGGRAGRFKSTKTSSSSSSVGEVRPTGYITAVDHNVLATIKRGMEAPVTYLESAVIWPTFEICSQLMIRYPPGTSFSFLLNRFSQQMKIREDKIYKLPEFEDRLRNIALFEHIEGLSFTDQLRLSCAPIKDMPLVKDAFRKFCRTIANRHSRGLLSYNFPFELLNYQCIDNEKFTLEQYEALYNIIMLFFWLSNRYPNYFIDTESAKDLKYFCELIIFEKLDRLKKNPYMQRGASGGIRSLYIKNRRR
ncbi:similar to Saccharomyces cerevisiae YPL029W SUV3 ATP-dependent RNA helicase, component of the mitochondrial degradosome along with the RNase Dss1p [Maudiozyma barnettii]|uniref:ATP-dependent RNA helicase SUV3, mitochondrial n=1 Tax=Maudiozyma barnettii TaxID=61262 RepID=A0A8H2VGS8_9SACH|nr:ATP-dependent RNA helicase SUV3 [Kazachstania barnettii]CAB4255156.1 similar to Saccharomyces cerevisiae YPL029W SUV3 ATP-dependent RNA helicase, component of the mitochondrial degradosome along with the RNase Dss1p [Kazachstania barnettii]CAD1783427.1 similar to Saccharomyces cerevisiae YPL029W SUV3 ATP-dependent RNA helicase, component of the mitochondrial degradosome along with the RNase Dss1p [Kazachstania barnettii]